MMPFIVCSSCLRVVVSMLPFEMSMSSRFFCARCQHSVVSAGVGDVLVDLPSLHLLDHARLAHHQDLGDVLGVLLQVVQEGLLLLLQVGSTQLPVDLAKALICCMGSVSGPKTNHP